MYKAIVAIDNNRVMWDSKSNDLPWRFSKDFRWFKDNTVWENIIMGRKTRDSLWNKPLPNRNNIIISQTLKNNIDGITVYNTIEQLINSIKTGYVIWWAEIFRLFSEKNLLDEVLITHIDGTRDGDIILPDIEKDMKTISQHTTQDIDKKDIDKKKYKLDFITYGK